ncbi:MAG TPA: 2OG-Fe(II) oxygenase [Acidimicrobiales bacterium]
MFSFLRPGVVVIDDLFDAADLGALTGVAEQLDYEDQDLGRGVVGRRQRAETDDSLVPDLLWSRLADVLPPIDGFFAGGPGTPRLDPPIGSWEAVGCNPRTRFYRYGLGAAFSEHEDEPWRPDPRRRSLLTVLAYVPCGGCDGGETVVDGEVVRVVDGRVLVFDHGLLHEGRPVEQGSKLTVRSDIVAQPGPPTGP